MASTQLYALLCCGTRNPHYSSRYLLQYVSNFLFNILLRFGEYSRATDVHVTVGVASQEVVTNLAICVWRWHAKELGNYLSWVNVKVKVKQSHRPIGFQEVEAPRFQANLHMKVVRLLALGTGRLYPPRKYSWYSFLLEAESNPGP
jgi:hypothetical protein